MPGQSVAESGVRPPTRSMAKSSLCAAALDEELPLAVLTLLALVEADHRAVVAHHAGPHFAAGALFVLEREGGGGYGHVVHGDLLVGQADVTARLRDRASSSH